MALWPTCHGNHTLSASCSPLSRATPERVQSAHTFSSCRGRSIYCSLEFEHHAPCSQLAPRHDGLGAAGRAPPAPTRQRPPPVPPPHAPATRAPPAPAPQLAPGREGVTRRRRGRGRVRERRGEALDSGDSWGGGAWSEGRGGVGRGSGWGFGAEVAAVGGVGRAVQAHRRDLPRLRHLQHGQGDPSCLCLMWTVPSLALGRCQLARDDRLIAPLRFSSDILSC